MPPPLQYNRCALSHAPSTFATPVSRVTLTAATALATPRAHGSFGSLPIFLVLFVCSGPFQFVVSQIVALFYLYRPPSSWLLLVRFGLVFLFLYIWVLSILFTFLNYLACLSLTVFVLSLSMVLVKSIALHVDNGRRTQVTEPKRDSNACARWGEM